MSTNTSEISYVAARPAGVYVHIPFCARRCDYCAFATWTGREALWGRYVEACRRQVRQLAEQGWGRFGTVFFGGGTPSLLPGSLLAGILGEIAAGPGLVPGAEVTVECNPETITPDRLAAYGEAGVTRLSFGAQSMEPHVLRSLGRDHAPQAVRDAVVLAERGGFGGRFNLDLIYGAAGESLEDWGRTLEEVIGFGPSHVSAYALTVEPGTPLSKDPSRFPLDDDQADKYLLAEEMLSGSGLAWYEISNWALPGQECRHNMLYWRQGDYAGVGCAAHSHRQLVEAQGPGGRRWWNVRTPERYCDLVEQGQNVVAGEELVMAGHYEREALMLSLRTRSGVQAERVPSELVDAGLVQLWGPGRAVLTVRGRLLANEVAVRLKASGAAHSSVRDWEPDGS